MADRITCSACGQEYLNTSNGSAEHECPGSPSDQDERITELEERVRVLEERLDRMDRILPSHLGDD